jgi:hypothetical protein
VSYSSPGETRHLLTRIEIQCEFRTGGPGTQQTWLPFTGASKTPNLSKTLALPWTEHGRLGHAHSDWLLKQTAMPCR